MTVPHERLLEISDAHYSSVVTLTNLAKEGINLNYLNGYKDDITAAKSFKTDKKIKEELAAVTREKETKLKNCIGRMSSGKSFLEKKYGKGSTQVLEFPDYDDCRSNESKMIVRMPEGIAVLEKYKTELLDDGMPADFITGSTADHKALDDINKLQEKQKEDNIAYTKQRNLADAKLVARINTINKAGRKAYADDPVNLHYFDSPWPSGSDEEGGEPNEDPPTPNDQQPTPNQ